MLRVASSFHSSTTVLKVTFRPQTVVLQFFPEMAKAFNHILVKIHFVSRETIMFGAKIQFYHLKLQFLVC